MACGAQRAGVDPVVRVQQSAVGVQQVLAERGEVEAGGDDLGGLEVGVPRHGQVAGLLGQPLDNGGEFEEGRGEAGELVAAVHHLGAGLQVVAAAVGVPAHDRGGQARLDVPFEGEGDVRHVGAGLRAEGVGPDGVQQGGDPVGLLGADQVHADVLGGQGLLDGDVVAQQVAGLEPELRGEHFVVQEFGGAAAYAAAQLGGGPRGIARHVVCSVPVLVRGRVGACLVDARRGKGVRVPRAGRGPVQRRSAAARAARRRAAARVLCGGRISP